MIQKDMVEKREALIQGIQERIAAAKTVKELLVLDEGVVSMMSGAESGIILSSMSLIANGEDGDEEQLKSLIEIASPYKTLFSLINKKIFELIPDTKALVATLAIINDKGSRERLLWKIDNLRHLSF